MMIKYPAEQKMFTVGCFISDVIQVERMIVLKKILMRGESLCGAGIILLASIFYIWSFNAPKEVMTWPRITLVTTMILTVIMIYLAYLGKGVAKPEKFKWGGTTFFMMISALAYISLLNLVGFIILTPIWCFFVFKIMGYQNKVISSIVSVVLTLVVFFIFKKLLYVPVPLGFLNALIY